MDFLDARTWALQAKNKLDFTTQLIRIIIFSDLKNTEWVTHSLHADHPRETEHPTTRRSIEAVQHI